MRPKASITVLCLGLGLVGGGAAWASRHVSPRGEHPSAEDGPARGPSALPPRGPPAAHTLLRDPHLAGPGLCGTPRPGGGDADRCEAEGQTETLGSAARGEGTQSWAGWLGAAGGTLVRRKEPPEGESSPVLPRSSCLMGRGPSVTRLDFFSARAAIWI